MHSDQNFKILKLPIVYRTDLELVEFALDIFAKGYERLRDGSKLEDRHISLLARYILYGYSVDTFTKWAEDKQRQLSYVYVINSELISRGYLVNPKGDRTKRVLSPKMEAFRGMILESLKHPTGMAEIRIQMRDKRKDDIYIV